MYKTLNAYYKERFGCKVYKLSIDAGFTCPNRDGTLGTDGCIFCNGDGGSAFAGKGRSVTQQLENAKLRIAAKVGDGKYIAYFQSFTNTYAPVCHLRALYEAAIIPEDVVGLAIGTRPDCLGDDVLALLAELNKQKPVFVELGLQTVHEDSIRYIRRGYDNAQYFDSDQALKAGRDRSGDPYYFGIAG